MVSIIGVYPVVIVNFGTSFPVGYLLAEP